MTRRREVAYVVGNHRFASGARWIRRSAVLFVAVNVIGAAGSFAAPPTINSISLRGLQIGGKTTIAIDGNDLLPAPRLILSTGASTAPAASAITDQDVRANGTSQHVEISATLSRDVAAGLYHLRVATRGGVSNPLVVGLDSLPQLPVVPELTTLPAAVSGTIDGGQVVQTTFTLKKSEPIIVEVEARRLGSALDPVMNVLDDRKLPLAWAEATTALGGDARLRFTAPADGRYTVRLHDSLYQAGSPGQFRLKIGRWHFADMVFPPAVRRGGKAMLSYVSTNLPAEAKVEFTMPEESGDQPAPWPPGVEAAGPRPRLLASDDEQVLRSPPGGSNLQEVSTPVGINGRVDKPRDEDRYRIVVAPGMRLRMEVTAARIGSPLDAVLFVRDEKGNQLAMNDDQAETVDPGLDFTVPPNVKAIVVALKDVAGRGGPDFVYHLAISRLDRPHFSLSVLDDRQLIPLGGSGLLRIAVNRAGYSGPIKLKFNGLPPDCKAIGDEFPPSSDLALVELAGRRGEVRLPDSTPSASIITITGRGGDGTTATTRTAQVATAGNESLRQPWLRSEVAVALIDSPAFGLAWSGASVEPSLSAGGKMPMNLKLSRGGGTTGPVRLSLVTTQPMPRKKVKVDNQDQEQDDPDRALRLEGSPMIAADQSEATVQILVPRDLKQIPYDLSIRGELLTADGKNVVAQTFTPVLRAKVVVPPTETKPPSPVAQGGPAKPLAIFEDQPEIIANLTEGGGQATLVTDDKFSGKAAVKVTPDQRYNPALPGLGVKIREKPGADEFRYLTFAWKKKGGSQICFQLNHDGQWGPPDKAPNHKFRYHAGAGPECFGASMIVDQKLPDGWILVTRDLYNDFGEFTLTGIALSPIDGDYALFDHIYLARRQADFDKIKP
jgi:hypothetical protein